MNDYEISAARDWLADCDHSRAYTWDEDTVARMIEREYEGGMKAFQADAVPMDVTPVVTVARVASEPVWRGVALVSQAEAHHSSPVTFDWFSRR